MDSLREANVASRTSRPPLELDWVLCVHRRNPKFPPRREVVAACRPQTGRCMAPSMSFGEDAPART